MSAFSKLKPGDLQRIRALAGLDEIQLQAFLDFAAVVTYEPMQTIVRQGDPGDSMFLILEGKTSVYALSRPGTKAEEKRFLRNLEVGQSFGEIALMNQIPRTASIEAVTSCVLITVTAASLHSLMEKHPVLAARFLHQIARSLGLQLADTSARLRSFWEQDGLLNSSL